VDHLSRHARSANMALIRAKDTKPELVIRKLLHARGLRYRIHDKRLPGKPDISIHKYKIVIEVKGCFWHQHEGCRFASQPKSNTHYWKQKLEKNKIRDQSNQILLEQLGFRLFTIWECETKNTTTLISRVDAIINYKNSIIPL